MELSDPSGSWQGLAADVAAGHLHLEQGIAERCAGRCADVVRELKLLQDGAIRLQKVDGLGHLPSGAALARKFEMKASGGEYSLDRAIADHIAVVEQMRDVFLAIESRYAAAEDATTATVTGVEARIN